jgi:hypothetical protein
MLGKVKVPRCNSPRQSRRKRQPSQILANTFRQLVQEARAKIGASHTRFSVLWALLRTPWALLQSSDWPRRQKYWINTRTPQVVFALFHEFPLSRVFLGWHRKRTMDPAALRRFRRNGNLSAECRKTRSGSANSARSPSTLLKSPSNLGNSRKKLAHRWTQMDTDKTDKNFAR